MPVAYISPTVNSWYIKFIHNLHENQHGGLGDCWPVVAVNGSTSSSSQKHVISDQSPSRSKRDCGAVQSASLYNHYHSSVKWPLLTFSFTFRPCSSPMEKTGLRLGEVPHLMLHSAEKLADSKRGNVSSFVFRNVLI